MAHAPFSERLATRTRPLVMGVVNVTPDSFSDGGTLGSVESAVAHGLALVAAGADMLDIGGESTRPGAGEVPVAQELERVVPVIAALAKATAVPLSIDTRKPEVARAAVGTGAQVWNDVSALTFAPDSLATALDLSVPVVLMHAQGTPETMQDAPSYRDVVSEVLAFLVARIGACRQAGLARELLLVDPGLGFGKTVAHNLALLRGLQRVTALGFPVLVGASRKSFIGRVDPTASDPLDRLGGSIGAALWSAEAGAAIVRVHDVRETVQALSVWQAIREAS